MRIVEQSGVALTQDVLRMGYLWNDSAIPDRLDSGRLAIHIELLDLIWQESRAEREATWQRVISRSTPEYPIDKDSWDAGWEARWQLTEYRKQELIRRHALAVRMAGRGVMRLNNAERLDEEGAPRSPAIAKACNLIPLSEIILFRPEEPTDILTHLRLAGFFGSKRTQSSYKTSPSKYMDIQIPEDAQHYLETYPPATKPQDGEMNRATMRTEFDASDNMLIGIITDHGLYPVVRHLEGRGGRESEFYTASDVFFIGQAVKNMPKIAEDETQISNIMPQFGGKSMFTNVLNVAGISSSYRRLPGQGRGLCIKNEDLPTLWRTYEFMTTLQEGEMGYEEIAAEMGVSVTTARDSATALDIEASRPLWPTEGDPRFPRRAFPGEVAERIIERIGWRQAINPRGRKTAATPPPADVPETTRRIVVPIAQPVAASDAVTAAFARVNAIRITEEKPVRDPLPHDPLKLAQIAAIMRVPPPRAAKEFLLTRSAAESLPISGSSHLPQHVVTGERAAVIARTLLTEKLQRIPSTSIGVGQIALVVNRHPNDVVKHLRASGNLAPAADPREATFNNKTLDAILASLGFDIER